MMRMVRVTILSRPDCHLCDVVAKLARRLEMELSLEVRQVSLEEDAQLCRQYGDRIPVVLVDGIEACAGKITEPELRRAIERTSKKARWRRPISRILSRLSGRLRRG